MPVNAPFGAQLMIFTHQQKTGIKNQRLFFVAITMK